MHPKLPQYTPTSLSVFEKSKYIPIIDKAIDEFSSKMLNGASFIETIINFIATNDELEELSILLASSHTKRNKPIDIDTECTGDYPLLVALVKQAFKHNFGSIYQLHTEG